MAWQVDELKSATYLDGADNLGLMHLTSIHLRNAISVNHGLVHVLHMIA